VDRVLLAGGGIGPLPGQSLDAVEGQLKALDLPPELLEQLVRGVSPDAVLGEVLQSLAVAVLHDLAQAQARRPLDAEVTVCDVFGMIALTAPEEVAAGEPERLRDVLLAFLVRSCSEGWDGVGPGAAAGAVGAVGAGSGAGSLQCAGRG
jgi:hypothetical protein